MDVFGIRLKNAGVSEIQNVKLETLSAHPETDNFVGRVYFNSTDSKFYFCSNPVGPVFIPFATGGDASALQSEVDAIETSLGTMVDGSGVFQASAFSGFSNVSSPTSLTNALSQLDAAIEGKDTLAELDDVTITTPSAGHVLYYTTEWVNAAPGSTSGVQAWDAALDSISGLSTSADQMIYTTGSDTYTTTSLTSFARSLLDDADAATARTTLGVQEADATLAALAAFNTNGYLVQTAADTFVGRTIEGTAGNVVVTNGDGVAANTSIDLATVSQANSGNFVKVTLDSYGRVTGNTAVVASDITGLVDATYVNVAGDTMTGNLAMNGNSVTGIAAPVGGTDATNKNYVDALVAGLTWKNAARVATTGPVTLATDLEAGDVVDGVTLVAGDRVLVKDQTNPEENGIYVVQASGAAVRSTDMDVAGEFSAATLYVKEGSTQANTGWTQTEEVTTVDTDDVVFVQFTGAGTFVAGVGLDLTGNTFSVNLGAGIAQLPTDEVGIHLYGSASGLQLTTDGTTDSTDTGAQLQVKVDGSTVTKDSSGIKVANAGITETHLNTSVAGAGLSGGAGVALAVNVDGSTIEITGDSLNVKDAGITNAKLTNSTVTMAGDTGSDAVALGETFTFVGGTGLNTTVGTNDVTFNFDANDITAAGADAAAGDMFVAYDVSASATRTFTLAELGNGIAGEINLGDLADVGTATPTAGHTIVGDGSAFQSKKIMHTTSLLSAATSHVITHGLNQRLVLVQVYDSSYNQIIPNNIALDSTTQCTISFGTNSVACYVVVMGV